MLYISIHSGTDLYQKKYMYAPRLVHTCTFLLSIVNYQLASLSFGCARLHEPCQFEAPAPHYGSPRYSNISLTW